MATAKEILAAAHLLEPIVEDVAHWLAGRGEHEPPVLAQLPASLRSEAALTRARARASTPPESASARIPNTGE
jgi:hypothetical protein